MTDSLESNAGPIQLHCAHCNVLHVKLHEWGNSVSMELDLPQPLYSYRASCHTIDTRPLKVFVTTSIKLSLNFGLAKTPLIIKDS